MVRGLRASLLLVGSAGLWVAGGCVSRTVIIESQPEGARVSVDGLEAGHTPFQQVLTWRSEGDLDSVHRILVSKDGHEPRHLSLGYEQARSAPEPWKKTVTLDPLTRSVNVRFESTPPGARVKLQSGPQIEASPGVLAITFHRDSSVGAWSSDSAAFSLEDHQTVRVPVVCEQVLRDPTIRATLPESRRVVPLDIKDNIGGATVQVNGEEVGKTPLRVQLEFARASGSESWNTFLIVVSKEGYRFPLQAGTAPQYEEVPFTKTLTLAEAETGVLEARFEPVRFRMTKVTRLRFTGEGVEIEEQSVLSQVGEAEREPKVGSATRITDWGALYETRIDAMNDSQRVVYSVPFTVKGEKAAYMNLWMQKGMERTRLTDARQRDVEAAVSADGQWVYFTSDRLGTTNKFNLWRISTQGKGGLTKITDSPSSAVDIEVAVSPDGKRLAYTSYLRGSKAPYIWVSNVDGTLPSQLRNGRNPAWSPDGGKIVFSEPGRTEDPADALGGVRDTIWVMDADGSNPTRLTAGEYDNRYPVWAPDGKRIVYVSNEAVNEAQEHNYDIWIMNADGTGRTQLTVNGSYDTRPAVTQDGKHIYFLSNRGARRADQGLQVWRIELPPMAVSGPAGAAPQKAPGGG